MPKNEFQRIAQLRNIFGTPPRGVTLGIGDDASVLEAELPMVWTVDAQVEGVHFERPWVSFEDLGWRSLMASASDLAAMGADAWCALVSVVLPPNVSDEEFEALARGEQEACELLGGSIVGGNLARGDAISISTTWLGRTTRAVERSGAKPGDALWLAGDVGFAGVGLQALKRGISDPALDSAIARFRRPEARITEGLSMAPVAHAAIDISDSLSQDAHHLSKASGVRLVIDESGLVSRSLQAACRVLDCDPVELALDGGEDYALLVASDRPIAGFRAIGRVEAGKGVFLRMSEGERPIFPKGFDHFAV